MSQLLATEGSDGKMKQSTINETLPSVVISLDFELRWGMHDKLRFDIDAYRENLEKVWQVVPLLLKLFQSRKIRVTWACVGALGCRDWDEYFSRAPRQPKYHDSSLAVSPQYAELDPGGQLHFALELLQLVHATPGQELGVHTFSHIYMREPGVTAEDVKADLLAASLLWKDRLGVLPISLTFPRNQYAFLDTIRACGIMIWRGNEHPWYYDCNEASTNNILPRVLRLIDSLNPLTRRASPLEDGMTRASLFLRLNLPYSAWRFHVARIRRELDTLRPREIFHLWWHPHNLGSEVSIRITRVEEICNIIAEKCERGLLLSQNMGDLVI